MVVPLRDLGGERGADFLVADLHHVLVTRVGLLHGGPLGHQLLGGGVQAVFALLGQLQRGFGSFGFAGLARLPAWRRRRAVAVLRGQAGLIARAFL
jgi:hypothetical protein